MAAGLASAGIGAGTVAVPLIATAAIAALQWRDAMRALAAGVLLFGLCAAWLLRRAPVASAARSGQIPGLSLREALRDRRFWWLYLSIVLAAPSMFIPFAHVSAAARDMGIEAASAVGLVGLIGIGSLVGRFVIGALADRLGRTLTLLLMQGSMGLSVLAWFSAGSYPMLVFFALWFGLSYGGIVSLLPRHLHGPVRRPCGGRHHRHALQRGWPWATCWVPCSPAGCWTIPAPMCRCCGPAWPCPRWPLPPRRDCWPGVATPTDQIQKL